MSVIVIDKEARILLFSPDESGIPRFFSEDTADSGTTVP